MLKFKENKLCILYKTNVAILVPITAFLLYKATKAFSCGSIVFSMLVPGITLNMCLILFLCDLVKNDRYYKYRNMIILNPIILIAATVLRLYLDIFYII